MVGGPAKAARRRRGRPARVDLRKAMFVLPNLFTVSSIFCGFYAITLCLDSPLPVHLYRAALAIFFGMFFDMADGRVARLTRTQSEFGVQLDSLADVLSFGCAPAVLLYRWALHELGIAGIFVAFLYVACGALRLARFNVLAARGGGATKDFVGLPIPLAAGAVVAMVMTAYPFEKPIAGGAAGVTAVTLTLALLMVSSVRYRAFKTVRPTKKTISLAFVVVLILTAISTQLGPWIALSILMLAYIADGLVEEVIFFRSRRAERAALRASKITEPDDEEPDEDLIDEDEREEHAPHARSS